MLRGLDAPVVPQSNETISFFHSAALPVEIIAGSQPFTVTVSSPTFDLEVDGAAPLLPPGQIAISEVNHSPAAGQQQWFEVRNNTATPRDLQGWTIDFGGGFFHEIATPVVLPANGFVVIGESASATEGGQVDYAYGPGLTFPAAGGSLGLGFAGVAYTRATWTAAGTAGVATQIDSGSGLTMAGAAVGSGVTCPATQSYGASGQLGTPGAAAASCFPYRLSAAAPNGFQSIGATGTQLTSISAHDTFQSVTLPRPVSIFGQPRSQLWVSSEGFVSFVSITESHYANPTTVGTGAPNGVLAPFWDDLQPGQGRVYWQQFDPDATPASGDEYTVISWENWRVGSGGGIDFQVVIREGSGDIEYHYGAMTSTDTGGARALGSSATTLLENEAGTAGAIYNVNSTNAPGIQPNTGLRFAFTP